MKEESHNPWTGPEIEARIVALVLGEASDFERDELNRLIEERPDLAAFKEQIQSVHGLLRDVGTGESLSDDDEWKLSTENRHAVLAVIGGDAEKRLAKQSLHKLAEKRRPATRNAIWSLTRIAAVFCFVGLLGSVAILAVLSYGSANSARLRRLASNRAIPRNSEDASKSSVGEAAAPSREDYAMDNARTTAADEADFRTAESVADLTFGSGKDSTSALEAIRGTLAFDAAATTGGVNGPEASPRQTIGYPTLSAKEEAEWPDVLNGDAFRLTDSQPTVEETGSGEVSLPRFAEGFGELNAFGRAGTVRSTVSVPDQGTILLGGVKRGAAGRSEPGVTGEPTVSSLMTHEYAESDSGGAAQDDVSDHYEVLGFNDRPVLRGESVSSGLVTLDEIEEKSNEHRQWFDLNDPPDAGEDKDFNSLAADGESLRSGAFGAFGGSGGLGGFGGANFGLADERKSEISAEHEPQGILQGESGIRRDTRDSKETAPSLPMAAGIGSRPEETDAGVFFESEPSDTPRIANSLLSPTNKPTASKDVLNSKGKPAVADRYQDEIAEESVTRPSDGDITVSNSHGLGQGKVPAQQMSDPLAGTATAQPRGGRATGQAKHDTRWGSKQVSRGDLRGPGRDSGTSPSVESKKMEKTDPGNWAHELNNTWYGDANLNGEFNSSAHTKFLGNTDHAGDLLSDDYGRGVSQPRARPRSELTHERDGSLRQRGQPAIASKTLGFRYVPPMLEDNSKSMREPPAGRLVAPAGLNEQTAEGKAFSTFSLHVSDVSFKLARTALAHGEWPEAAKVRIEEFVNAFDYGDPMPSQNEKVACWLEQSIHPFLQQRNLLRVSMRTAAAGRSSNTPLRLTLLLDNSGSMERIDRQQTVRRAFALLAQQLKPIDQITLISFARQPRLLADKVNGAQSHQLVQLIHDLPSEGGTNIEAALQLAYEKAQEQQIDDAQNRIILLTDGAVNLGDANPNSLSRMITTMRNAGIAFDAAGISAEGLNDDLLEALTRKGDGRYYLLDSLEAADDGFARQVAGALRPSAKNVKVQIEFNPKRVGRYKLLGFEKHRLKREDFHDDKVDAAEMAAAEAGVAVYQFEAKPDGEGDVGSVSVRFRDLSTGQMIESRWPIPYEADAPRPDQAAPSLRIATCAALLAAKLRGEPLGETVDLKTLSDLIAGLPDRDRNTNRVQQLQLMIQQARQIGGK